MKFVYYVLRHIYNRACIHVVVFFPDLDFRLSTDNIIDFVLRVWRLRVDATGWEDVESHAEIRDFKKFEVEFVA